jgi:hypothetical protein
MATTILSCAEDRGCRSTTTRLAPIHQPGGFSVWTCNGSFEGESSLFEALLRLGSNPPSQAPRLTGELPNSHADDPFTGQCSPDSEQQPQWCRCSSCGIVPQCSRSPEEQRFDGGVHHVAGHDSYRTQVCSPRFAQHLSTRPAGDCKAPDSSRGLSRRRKVRAALSSNDALRDDSPK